MANLYEIISEIENFNYEFDEETGEMLNAKALDELELAKNEKIENCCLYIKNLLADAEAYKNEEKSFAEKRKHAEKKAEGLKRYVKYCLAGDTYKSDRVSVSYRKSEQVIVPDDIYSLNDEFLRYKTPEADKTKIKAALKAGETVEGCSIITKQNITIK